MNKQMIVAVSGVKNSGKTTFINKMIPIFCGMRLKVAVIKHDGHVFLPDPPNTDTGRYMLAGAFGSAVFDGSKYKIIKREPISEKELMDFFPDVDIILLEGFKGSQWPKFEIIRKGVSKRAVCNPQNMLAFITDLKLDFSGVPVIGLDDYKIAVRMILDRKARRGLE